MYGVEQVTINREEKCIIYEALFDHYKAMQKELWALTDRIKAEGQNPRLDFGKYKLEQYLETLAKLKSKFGMR